MKDETDSAEVIKTREKFKGTNFVITLVLLALVLMMISSAIWINKLSGKIDELQKVSDENAITISVGFDKFLPAAELIDMVEWDKRMVCERMGEEECEIYVLKWMRPD